MIHFTLMLFILIHIIAFSSILAVYILYLKTSNPLLKRFIFWYLPIVIFNGFETIAYYSYYIMKNTTTWQWELKSHIASLFLFLFIYNILVFTKEITGKQLSHFDKYLFLTLSLFPEIVTLIYFRLRILIGNDKIYTLLFLCMVYLAFSIVKEYGKRIKDIVPNYKPLRVILILIFILWLSDICDLHLFGVAIANSESISIFVISIIILVFSIKQLIIADSIPVPLNSEKDISALITTFSDMYDLSFREREVLSLMVAGKTNIEIGESLFISLNTVKTHVSNIFRKSGLKNRISVVTKINEL